MIAQIKLIKFDVSLFLTKGEFMKKLILLFVVIQLPVFLVGCGLSRSDYFYKSYKVETEYECYIGETMILEESGVINNVYNTVYPGGIRWELVYAGKSNDVIKIYYREYVAEQSGWLAKDAFTQELNYDLNEGNTIRYKKLQIEVISANNEKINYRVLPDKTTPSKEG